MTQDKDQGLAAYFDQCAIDGDMAEFDYDERTRLDGFLREWRIVSGDRIFEPGCGTGRLTEVLAAATGSEGYVLAMDLSAEMVARARARALPEQVDIRQASVLSIPATDGSIDKIICLNVFPHFEDRGAALGGFFRVMRTGGDLWINHFASREAINEFHAGLDPTVRDHLIPPDSEVYRLLEESGFEMVSHEDDDPGYRLHAMKK